MGRRSLIGQGKTRSQHQASTRKIPKIQTRCASLSNGEILYFTTLVDNDLCLSNNKVGPILNLSVCHVSSWINIPGFSLREKQRQPSPTIKQVSYFLYLKGTTESKTISEPQLKWNFVLPHGSFGAEILSVDHAVWPALRKIQREHANI
uniref:Uncharacterized protein n=1 Tax=Cucumis melo TaxID=3656 RepID=A0A9I9E8X8_CUCME